MLDSFLRPTQIKTNQDGGLLRLIACVCMFIDHAGKMLFPQLTPFYLRRRRPAMASLLH